MKTGGRVTIALLCGGGCRGAAVNLDIVGADLGVYFDVPQEIASLSLDRRVIPVPLAEGETVGSLVAKFASDSDFQEVCPILSARSGDLAQGLGQTPVLGVMAYEDLKLKGQLAQLWQEVLDKVRELTNGAPERVIILVLGSNSGGTGRGMLLRAASDLVETLRETEAVVVVEHVRVGAQTFNGLGHHIPLNNGVGVTEDLTGVLGPPAEREIRYLFGVELPMVREDTAARDRYTQLYLQAWAAGGVQEALGRSGAARVLTETFGRIRISQAGFWTLPGAINPMASAAARLQPDVQALIADQSGSTGILRGFELRPSARVSLARPADRAGLLTLARTPHKTLPADYWTQHVAQEYEHSGAVRAVAQGQEMPLGTMLVSLPNTIGSFRERRRFLFGLFREIQRRLGETRQEVETAQRGLNRTRRSINSVLRHLFPRPISARGLIAFLAAVLHILQSLDALLRRAAVRSLEEFLDTYDRLEGDLEELKAREEVLVAAGDAVRQKINEHEAVLERIQRWLLEVTQQEGVALGLFRVRGLDEGVFADLLLASQSNSHSYFETAVWRSLIGVTRQGLGAILLGTEVLGASDLSAEVLALQLSEEPPELTPPWGGKVRRDSPQALVVMPPVSQDLLVELQQALRNIGSPLQLVTADTVSGGVAAVLLRIYSVSDRDALLTRQYRGGFARAVQEHWYPLARATGSADEEARKLVSAQGSGGG